MKNVNVRIKQFGLVIVTASVLVVACQKSSTSDTPAQQKSLSVFLTDDPSLFSSVLIDIKTVEVKIDENKDHDSHFADNDKDTDNDHKGQDQFGKWDTLAIKPGVYDIMKLRNGIDTVLGQANIPTGRIGKIRLTLGNNNSVMVANVSHPLVLAPGANNYVYAKIEENDVDETTPGRQGVWVDFDLAASVKEVNGVYYLKPTLKAFGMEKFGRIDGMVLPKDAHAFVKAILGTDTSWAVPNEGDGDYKIRGLKEGVYSLQFKSPNGYKDTTVSNIQVLKGKETKVPTITMHK